MAPCRMSEPGTWKNVVLVLKMGRTKKCWAEVAAQQRCITDWEGSVYMCSVKCGGWEHYGIHVIGRVRVVLA